MKADRSNRWVTVLLTLALAGATGWAWTERKQRAAAQEAAALERRQRALAESDAERMRTVLNHSQKERREAAEKPLRAEVERDTARLRNLPFRKPVEYKTLRRADVRDVLRLKLEEHYSDADFANLEVGYAAMGLLPEGFRLKEGYINLLGEQVAAFYDQHAHRLYLFDHTTMDSAQNRMILAHELTHALQDQHFTLKSLLLDAKDNDDRALAASALVEGDATLLMYAYLAENLTPGALRDTVVGSLLQNVEQLHNAPRILRESLLFPYMEGAKFCTALQGAGGFDDISAAFARPPSSTTEIFHPHKYFAKWQPLRIQWADTAIEGQRPMADNVLGELGLRALFADWVDEATAPTLAAGWKGDRYLVFPVEGAKPALVWRVAWERPELAAAFVGNIRQMWEKRYEAKLAATSAEGRVEMTGAGRTLRALVISPTERLIIDAPDAETANKLERFRAL